MTEGVYLVAMTLGALAFCGVLITALVALGLGRGLRLQARYRTEGGRTTTDGAASLAAERAVRKNGPAA